MVLFRSFRWHQFPGLLIIYLFSVCFLSPPLLQAAETFLEPIRVIELRSPYQITVEKIHVAEGDTVEPGTLLVELDSRTLAAREKQLLEIASFHGVLDSAKAVLKMQQERLLMVEKLSKSGNARKKELEKVRTDVAISKAKVLEAEEKRAQVLLDLEIVRSQIDERRLRSPIPAVVLDIDKRVSEMTAPTDPEPVIRLVQLDPLLAVFHLPLTQAQPLHQKETVTLLLSGNPVEATIDFISPVIEAQSGTVRVRFQIANPEGKLLSGSRIRYEPK